MNACDVVTYPSVRRPPIPVGRCWARRNRRTARQRGADTPQRYLPLRQLALSEISRRAVRRTDRGYRYSRHDRGRVWKTLSTDRRRQWAERVEVDLTTGLFVARRLVRGRPGGASHSDRFIAAPE